MGVYVGMDVHGKRSHVAILDNGVSVERFVDLAERARANLEGAGIRCVQSWNADHGRLSPAG